MIKRLRVQIPGRAAGNFSPPESGLAMLLSRHSVGTYLELRSHATYQGMLSHSHLSSLSQCGLILAERVE